LQLQSSPVEAGAREEAREGSEAQALTRKDSSAEN